MSYKCVLKLQKLKVAKHYLQNTSNRKILVTKSLIFVFIFVIIIQCKAYSKFLTPQNINHNSSVYLIHIVAIKLIVVFPFRQLTNRTWCTGDGDSSPTNLHVAHWPIISFGLFLQISQLIFLPRSNVDNTHPLYYTILILSSLTLISFPNKNKFCAVKLCFICVLQTLIYYL